jgi:hypothetical protein
MYTLVWKKYLPIIRILIKRSVTADQSFALNTSDFEKIGPNRKTGYRFNIAFNRGRAEYLANTSHIGKDLAQVLLEDPAVKEQFGMHDFHFTVNPKLQLTIRCTNPQTAAKAVSEEAERS